MARTVNLDYVRNSVGKEVGLSDWREITQEQIDAFAKATDDYQWIHVDPERAARETPFGGTIAHGFLTLSILSTLAYDALPVIEGAQMSMNYGFDKIRFSQPVRTGKRVRARFVLSEADIRKSGRVLNTYEVTLEIEGSPKPAFVATWKTLTFIPPPDDNA